MSAQGLESVLSRNQFYWASYRLIVFSFLLLLLNIFLLGGFAIYQRYTFPTPKYFGTTPDGRPIQVVSLTEPYVSPDSVLQWTSQAILDIYSLDFVNWRKTLQASAMYFTQRGYWNFLAALKASTNLEAVKTLKQVVTAQITDSGTILRKGQLKSNLPYSWDLQLPVLITYQNSDNKVIEQAGVAIVRVVRESTLRYSDGLAIDQLVLQAR